MTWLLPLAVILVVTSPAWLVPLLAILPLAPAAIPEALEEVRRSRSPNQYTVAPSGFFRGHEPDRLAPTFAAPPEKVQAALRDIIAAGKSSRLVVDRPGRLQVVTKSRLYRYPDDTGIAILPVPGGASVAVYARSRYGRRDFGVNKSRVESWFAELERRLSVNT